MILQRTRLRQDLILTNSTYDASSSFYTLPAPHHHQLVMHIGLTSFGGKASLERSASTHILAQSSARTLNMHTNTGTRELQKAHGSNGRFRWQKWASHALGLTPTSGLLNAALLRKLSRQPPSSVSARRQLHYVLEHARFPSELRRRALGCAALGCDTHDDGI